MEQTTYTVREGTRKRMADAFRTEPEVLDQIFKDFRIEKNLVGQVWHLKSGVWFYAENGERFPMKDGKLDGLTILPGNVVKGFPLSIRQRNLVTHAVENKVELNDLPADVLRYIAQVGELHGKDVVSFCSGNRTLRQFCVSRGGLLYKNLLRQDYGINVPDLSGEAARELFIKRSAAVVHEAYVERGITIIGKIMSKIEIRSIERGVIMQNPPGEVRVFGIAADGSATFDPRIKNVSRVFCINWHTAVLRLRDGSTIVWSSSIYAVAETAPVFGSVKVRNVINAFEDHTSLILIDDHGRSFRIKTGSIHKEEEMRKLINQPIAELKWPLAGPNTISVNYSRLAQGRAIIHYLDSNGYLYRFFSMDDVPEPAVPIAENVRTISEYLYVTRDDEIFLYNLWEDNSLERVDLPRMRIRKALFDIFPDGFGIAVIDDTWNLHVWTQVNASRFNWKKQKWSRRSFGRAYDVALPGWLVKYGFAYIG